MAVLDSFSLVLILFILAMMGWLADFYLYISSDIADGLTDNPSILGIKSNLLFISTFIHSNFFTLALVLSLTNFVLGSRTTLNPVWAGMFAVSTLLLFWLMNYYIVPMLFQTLTSLEGFKTTNMNWGELFYSNWYLVAISGVVGTLIGYIKGVKNDYDTRKGLRGGARRWR